MRALIISISVINLCAAASWGLQNSPPVSITGQSNVVISGLQITGSAECVMINNCNNVVVENNRLGSCGSDGVKIYNSKNVTVRYNYIEHSRAGVNAIQSQTIVVEHNNFFNMQGPFPGGQHVQFNTVTGAGNRIQFNQGEDIEGQSNPEDLINMYGSNGLVNDPILITDNKFRGGGPSPSGGGIMTGDNYGSYMIVKNNILVNPGNYGIAIGGGHDIQLLDNMAFQEKKTWSNFPAYIWDWQSLGNCYGHVIRGNRSTFTNKNGQIASLWYGQNTLCTYVDISLNNWNAGLTAAILPTPLWTTEIPQKPTSVFHRRPSDSQSTFRNQGLRNPRATLKNPSTGRIDFSGRRIKAL